MINPNKIKVHTFVLKGTAVLAVAAIFAVVLLFTGCSDGGSGDGNIEGVWKLVSIKRNSDPLETYPETVSAGTTLQPYLCFSEGKVYIACEMEITGDPANSGLFKGTGEFDTWNIPYTFANGILTIEGVSVSFIISGNTATATISDGSGTEVTILTRVSSPTVEEIKAAKTS